METIEQEIRNLIFERAPSVGRPRKDDSIAAAVDPTNEPVGPSERRIARAIALQERNAHLALEHFGFGSMFWPTLQDIADRYEGLETRERVRQILNACVFERIDGHPRPVSKAVAELVDTRSFWPEGELIDVLSDAGLIYGLEYARGLLEYIQAQDMLTEWHVVKPDLKDVTRQSYREHGQCFVVTTDYRSHLSKVLKRAQMTVGLNGLCRLSHVDDDTKTASDLLALLKAHNKAWVTFHEGNFWYTFGDRQNSLVGNATKTFSLVDHCDLDTLAEMLRNSLHSRSSKFKEFPDAALVRKWITRTDHFRVDGETVFFRGETTEFSEVEGDLIDILEGQGPQKTSTLRKKLGARGHGDALCSKIVFHSPLIHLDRSGGRKNFLLTLATDLPGQEVSEHDDYLDFKARLDALESTDKDTTGTIREEQRILSEWIFRGATQARCAICDREFARGALITAHKKKRAHCTETERRDPHIVFPLCIFGCDYLYEKDFLRVIDGQVSHGRAPTGETETAIIKGLVGHRVHARWRAGPADYFDMTTGRDAVDSGIVR